MIQDSSSKKVVMFFLIPAEGREVSVFIFHGRKLNNERQLNNKRQLNKKVQLNWEGQLVKKGNYIFSKPGRRPESQHTDDVFVFAVELSFTIEFSFIVAHSSAVLYH